jgi:hypothetical protein
MSDEPNHKWRELNLIFAVLMALCGALEILAEIIG